MASIKELFQTILHFFRLDKKSPFVRDWVDRNNMRASIAITIYTVIMERFMYNRTVMLWGLIPRNLYNTAFYVLGFSTLQLFIVALLYLSGKVRSHRLTAISLSIFVLACCIVGQGISVYDYAIGKQTIVFLPLVAWIFALLLLNPFASGILAWLSFMVIPDYTNNRIIISTYVDRILIVFAVMLIIISIVRWVSQIRSAEGDEKLNQMNTRLEHISRRDELTAVKNRHGLQTDTDGLIGKEIFLVMSDIDDFKYYNDTYGHDTGDLILKHMSDTMVQVFGDEAVYRFGGDEFLLIVRDGSEAELISRLKEWKQAFHSFVLEGKTLHLSSTSGYAMGKVHAPSDLSAMVSLADAKLYEGKMNHKGGISGEAYDPEKKNEGSKLSRLESGLRSGEVDGLTKLPNMFYFRSRAELTVDVLRSSNHEPVLVYINIAGFKDYNRKFGFEAGDDLLKQLAELLTVTFDQDLVCRFADDHFAVITSDGTIEEEIKEVNQKLQERAGSNAKVSVQAGLYRLSDETVDVSLACDCARQAMANHHGSEIVGWYDEEMRANLERRQYITDHLDEALEQGWIENEYQPIFRSINRKVCGFEVLPRWNDPTYGVLEPELYVPILEESRQINEHDLYVLKLAAEEFRIYQSHTKSPVPVVVNLSYRDLDLEDITERILSSTEGIDHSLIHFDINAAALHKMNPHIHQVLEELTTEGFQFWMDGFGTENSTVDILYNFQMHGVKIDIRMLREKRHDSSYLIFLSHIISMCKQMGIATLALGVETEQEAQFLTEAGCEYMQGYFFYENVTLAEFKERNFIPTLPTEDVSEEAYYSAVSRVDLSKPARLDYDEEIESVTEELPAAICEYRDGTFVCMTSNQAFRSFLKTRKIGDVEEFTRLMNRRDYYIHDMLEQMNQKILETNRWETMDIGTGGKACTCSFHVISRNDKAHANTIIGVVVDMNLYREVKEA
ncbi:MAG: EAL domain-containing protein [Solobacterium sp.]|nr:EAL domain-containing protein [Solobacterium sp.]